MVSRPRLLEYGSCLNFALGSSTPWPTPWRRGATLDRACHLQQTRNQRRPAGLVTRPEAAAIVAVKILVEEHQVLPMRVIGKAAFGAVAGTPALPIRQEESCQPAGQFMGNLR